MNSPHKKFTRIVVLSVLITIFHFSCKDSNSEKKIISHSENQISLMLEEAALVKQNGNSKNLVSPRTLDAGGNLVLVPSKDWTSGFFPGVMWYLYELTGKEMWQEKAIEYTKLIENEKYNGGTHDMGFKIYCSFGNSYRLTGKASSRAVIIEAATTLAARYNPVTSCIRSWDHNTDKWGFPVIIDNLMNLELLFAATRLTGDPAFSQIAVSHADKTMKNHFREDFSTWHVVDYDTLTGEVIKKNTHQGFSDNSTWSRGEAWALYGYTLCFRETNNKKYLQQAENIAGFILSHPSLPEDLIPYWDYDAPNIPDAPRDASAAAIMASALYELSVYSKNGVLYKEKAETIFRNLANGYLTKKNGAKGFILLHSTGSAPANSEVDVPLIFSDYYFLEALVRAKRLEQGKLIISSYAGHAF